MPVELGQQMLGRWMPVELVLRMPVGVGPQRPAAFGLWMLGLQILGLQRSVELGPQMLGLKRFDMLLVLRKPVGFGLQRLVLRLHGQKRLGRLPGRKRLVLQMLAALGPMRPGQQMLVALGPRRLGLQMLVAPGPRKPVLQMLAAPGPRKPVLQMLAVPVLRRPVLQMLAVLGPRKPGLRMLVAPGPRKPGLRMLAAPGPRRPGTLPVQKKPVQRMLAALWMQRLAAPVQRKPVL